MVGGTGHIPCPTHLCLLVTGLAVLAVIHTIANLRISNAPMVVAGEFALRTLWVGAVNLICAVSTIILMVTLPSVEDTAPVAAPVLCRGTGVIAAVVSFLITVVSTVIVSVAHPRLGYAPLIVTSEVPRVRTGLDRRFGGRIFRAPFAVIFEFFAVGTSTLSLDSDFRRIIRYGEAQLLAATI